MHTQIFTYKSIKTVQEKSFLHDSVTVLTIERKIMGTSTMMFFITFILISFKSPHIFVVNGEGFRVRREGYNGVPKGLIFEKISAFLRFKGFNPIYPSKNGKRVYGSLLPSPSPAPAPAPIMHIHLPRHHPHPRRFGDKIPKKDEKRGVIIRVLIAVIVSVGAAFVIFSLGFIWVCKKLKKRRNEVEIRVLARRNGGRDKGKSVKNMNSDPGSGRFYLESIETAFSRHNFCDIPYKETGPSCKIIEVGGLGGEMKKTDSESVEFSQENAFLQENAKQIDYENDGSCIKNVSFHDDVEQSPTKNFKSSIGIVPFHENNSISDDRLGDECSSDNDSFHSFCDSHSSNNRLSNASSKNLSPKRIIFTPNSIPSPANPILEPVFSSKSDSKIGFTSPPPPPPPPPLPPRSHVSPAHHSYHLTTIKSEAISSSTLPFSLSPTNSDSSSQAPSKNFGGIPPPPFPPHQRIELGKDGSPLAKLKPLHWDKVRAAPDRSMVWDKLKTNSFEFDEEMMESLFRYNMQSCSKSDEAKSKSPSPTKHLLEPKRLQNINILLKALNVNTGQVCEALLQGKGLCLQQLEALAKMVPTNEEEAKLLSYKGDTNGLSSAELFIKKILNIPLAFSRIEAMLYRETFEDEIVHLRRSFSILEEACKELRSSRLFFKLLEAVLKTGNRMNIGTMRGGARAFKLDALLKLADVKGTDGKTTLLHFVVQEMVRSEGLRISESIMGKINLKSKSNNIAEKEENCRKMGLDLVAGLTTELCNVKKTATIDLDVLVSAVSNLSDGMVKVNLLLSKDLFVNEKNEMFPGLMRSYVCYAEKNLKELREDEGRVLLRIREITEYFHGNISKEEDNPLRIFVIVRDFLGMLDHVCKELRSSKVSGSPNPRSPFR